MLNAPRTELIFAELTDEGAAMFLDDFSRADIPLHSVVGHQATADLLTKFVRGCSWYNSVSANRENYTLQEGDALLVFQLLGRLPEGTVLNDVESAPHRWYLVLHVGDE